MHTVSQYSIESNNPRTCDYATGLPDDPHAEMQAATTELARMDAERSERLALMDAERAASLARLAPPSAKSAQPVERAIACECGRLVRGDLCVGMFVKSPKTGFVAQLQCRHLDQLPPRVRNRIHNADLADCRARFTKLELDGILKLHKLGSVPVTCKTGPMVSTGRFTFARHRR